jgi:hypothetical protein
MVLDHLGAVLVAVPREPAGQRNVIVEPRAGLYQRNDRGRDPALVHLVERHLRGPLRRPAAAAFGRHDVGVNGRDVVVVNVDPGFCRNRRLRQRRGGAESKTCNAACNATGKAAGQEGSAGGVDASGGESRPTARTG